MYVRKKEYAIVLFLTFLRVLSEYIITVLVAKLYIFIDLYITKLYVDV